MMLWLLSYELWLFGSVRSAGEFSIRWSPWQPWVCMCDLHQQARIRHFVVRGSNITFAPKTSDFWQEKPCSLHDCGACLPEECPGGPGNTRSSFLQQFKSLSSPKPHEVQIPLPPETDLPSYDSLPSVDDVGHK